jgi:hypothetical protein
MRRRLGIGIAAVLLASTTIVFADDIPLGAENRDSPMQFIIHSQPDRYPHHIRRGAEAYMSSAPQAARAPTPAPTAAELLWMDRASRGGEGR